MKRLFIALLALGVLASCDNKKDTPKEEVKLGSDSKIYVSYQATKADENGLETAEYIVNNCTYMRVKPLNENSTGGMNLGSYENDYESHRDLANNKFVFYATDAVDEEGNPGMFFQFEDVTFTVAKFEGKRIHPLETQGIQFDEIDEDTVAYVPNAVVMKCREAILAAIAKGDREEAYRVMMEDFVFIPIKDGAEWRRLEGK